MAMEVMNMPMDGNCLFHALGYLRDGATGRDRAQELRREIIGFMETCPWKVIGGASLEEWVKRESGLGMKEYVKKMSGGAWGGGLELAVYVELVRKGVMVFVPGAKVGVVDLVAAFGEVGACGGSEEVLALLYVGGAHYDVVRVSRDGRFAERKRRRTIDWARKVEEGRGEG
jgi:hypothetical protein